MDLLEHAGKRVLAAHGVPVPVGHVAFDVDQAVAAGDAIGYPVVVKAQVPVGGRGKAGGIKVANDAAELAVAAGEVLGMSIKGHFVHRIWVEEALTAAREIYFSFTFDRAAKLHLGMLSGRGGIDIEQVAAEFPEAIHRFHVNPLERLSEAEATAAVEAAGITGDAAEPVAGMLVKLYDAYTAEDAELVEVNPLAVVADGRVLAMDAKVILDDNAAWRHPGWEEWRYVEGLDPRERSAREKGLTYVGLDGSVGIIGNGAGLVMATLDVVAQVGGRAANFLDVGGGAAADVITAALEVVNADPAVRAIFVNIFGGITRGEEVANGIVEALGRVELHSPIVVRLDGTNAEEGRAILASHESDRLVSRPTMLEAARTAVTLAASGPSS
ncbi:MAG: Succinyl-CoA ligase [ADP-forming] beta chain [uncultured Acidimicrobiales bacterium]|uniref:Succinate--CoA ligase [ADP-forming] subunit beta n=1 Tax=uncultured Acidimicrobiales bacterium TaxID=310071 RepID=A0A6J4I3C7_9ACTN|nr:MAG: Succinyl-CoA ligase [ADP-forming] beta chain [uncultured Acidimicrobiales bacterium]